MIHPFLRLGLVASVSALPLLSADWPQWRGPSRTGLATESLPEKLPAQPRVLWKKAVGDGFASPIVAGGTVFHLDRSGNRERVNAWKASDGTSLWTADLDAIHSDGFGGGPRCTPVATADRVFAQSCRGELKALSPADGSVVWSRNYVRDFGATYVGERGNAAGSSRHGYNATPLLDGPNLITLAGGTNGSGIVCLRQSDGAVVWASTSDTPAYAPPVIAEPAGVRQVIAFTVQGALGLDPATGRELWRVPLTTTYGRHVITPLVHGDLVIVASHQIGTIAIRIARSGTNVTAETAWKNADAGLNFAHPVAVQEHLFGIGPQADFACYALRDGTAAWSQKGRFSSSADKTYSGLLTDGTRVLALTDGGLLVLFSAEAAGYRELGQAQVCGNTWCNPALADGRLFLRDRKDLMCLELAGP
jgi:outer membrane protein assembly factor BamB